MADESRLDKVDAISNLNGTETIIMVSDPVSGKIVQYDAMKFIKLIRNNLKIGGRNLAKNSSYIIKGASSSAFTYYAIIPTISIKSNTEYTLTIEKTEILSGTDIPSFSVLVFDPFANKGDVGLSFPVSASRQSITFKTGNLLSSSYQVFLYTGTTGSSADRQMGWTEVMLEESNIASDWMPAPEDILSNS